MPALGAIGKTNDIVYRRILPIWSATNALVRGNLSAARNAYAKPMPLWGYAHQQALNVSVAGSLSGTVTESNTPVPNAWVYCYYRANGNLIDRVKTNAAGQFSFYRLDPTDTNDYFVVALDPDGGVQYNALIFDRLTPV